MYLKEVPMLLQSGRLTEAGYCGLLPPQTWQYAVLQVIALLESILIYLPFARKYDKMLLEEEAKTDADEALA